MEQSCKACIHFQQAAARRQHARGGLVQAYSSPKYAQAKLVLGFGGLREVAQAKDLGPQGKRWGSETFFLR